MLDEFFRSHPNVKNGITFNSKVYIIGEYLQSRGKKNFNLIGYDLLERNVTCLKEGKRFLPHRPATGTARPQRHQGALRSPHFQERRDLHQLYAD